MRKFKIITLAIALGLLSTLQMQASHDGKDSKVKQQIAKKISNPGGENQGVVNAQFTITENGEIEIIEVQSQNKSLKAYIKGKLEKMTLRGKDIDTNEVFNLNFTFKKET